MPNMEKKLFKITIWYFKPNGKFYTDATFEREFRCTNDTCYMPDVAAWIRGNRKEMDALPGLSGEGWDGFIVINCEEGFPVLIKPEEA